MSAQQAQVGEDRDGGGAAVKRPLCVSALEVSRCVDKPLSLPGPWARVHRNAEVCRPPPAPAYPFGAIHQEAPNGWAGPTSLGRWISGLPHYDRTQARHEFYALGHWYSDKRLGWGSKLSLTIFV